MNEYDVVIVGAGHAGVSCAASLVEARYPGSIALIGDEKALPYERPPLSKEFLKGDLEVEDLALRGADWWKQSGVARELGATVTRIDAAQRTLWTDRGEAYRYGSLVWAAGGQARRLPIPGNDLGGVHVVRTLDDAQSLKANIQSARHAVIIGAGYIGLEAAASFRRHGLETTVVEFLPRPLQRVAGEDIADYLTHRHRANGVHFAFNTQVQQIRGAGGRVADVELVDGRVLPADVVIFGVGITPNTDVLAEAGADVADGVLVDDLCRTSLPHVFAIGDCASIEWDSPTGRIRQESIQNAHEQARIVAGTIRGQAAVGERAVSWFWSNQYDIKVRTAGVLTGYDSAVLRGSPDSDKFSVVYLRGACVLAVDTVNNVRDFTQAKSLVGHSISVSVAELSDPAVDLKSLVSSATVPRAVATR